MLRGQSFANLIFAIYDLICEIKFRVTKKYWIYNEKPHDFIGKTHNIDINYEIKFPEIWHFSVF